MDAFFSASEQYFFVFTAISVNGANEKTLDSFGVRPSVLVCFCIDVDLLDEVNSVSGEVAASSLSS